eukprot:gene6399-7423_t
MDFFKMHQGPHSSKESFVVLAKEPQTTIKYLRAIIAGVPFNDHNFLASHRLL